MRHLVFLLAVLAVAATAVFCLTGTLYSQQGPDVKIGVVDLQEVSTRFDKWKRLAKDLETESEKSNAELAKKEKELAELQEMLKEFEPGSEKHTEVQIEFKTKEVKLRSFFEKEQKRLKGRAEKMGGELLDNIEKVIQQYGRENGFTLIIKKEELPVEGRDWNELRGYVSRKSVMYYAPNIDITEKAVQILNNRFK